MPLYVTTTVYRETAAVEVERDVNAAAEAYAAEKKLEETQRAVKSETDLQTEANLCHEKVFAAMQELREYCDRLETLVPKELWPFPTYGDLLLYV